MPASSWKAWPKMEDGAFSEQDLAQIEEHGLSVESVELQLERFKRGPLYVQLLRPCLLGDGIRQLSTAEIQACQENYRRAADQGRAMKFVPASGAGSRMFHKFMEGWHGRVDDELAAALRRLHAYPFYPALREKMLQSGLSLEQSLAQNDFAPVLEYLLGPQGLGYAAVPKGLIDFHLEPDGARSALEEQAAEAAELTADREGRARIHFTVPVRYRQAIRDHLASAAGRLAKGGRILEITDSIQEASTDTIAADENNLPFRDRQGRLVFRPAGHGALLENLQKLGGDVVFIKNIDNVAPARLRQSRLNWERSLGGLLVELQSEAFDRLRRLEAGESANGLEESSEALIQAFGGAAPAEWHHLSLKQKADWLYAGWNRPIRVAGMVPNQGEPGGAPFWARDGQGRISAQIIESVQVDPSSDEQQRIFHASTHFNPVLLACGLRDFKGLPFDLRAFADTEAGFLSLKSFQGKPLKALELPGLWNGSMAYWNTVFVEIPIETFTPVKTVDDLLRPEHRSAPL